MNHKDTLFSIPTICANLPAIQESSPKMAKNTLELLEDDWRQIEFISISRQPEIAAEMAGIAEIIRHKSVEKGDFHFFTQMQVRTTLNTPLSDRMTPADLLALFPQRHYNYEGVSYRGVVGMIKGGLAFRLDDLINIYAVAEEGYITVLGLVMDLEVGKFNEFTAQALYDLMSLHNLYLVDWYRCARLDAGLAPITAYLKSFVG